MSSCQVKKLSNSSWYAYGYSNHSNNTDFLLDVKEKPPHIPTEVWQNELLHFRMHKSTVQIPGFESFVKLYKDLDNDDHAHGIEDPGHNYLSIRYLWNSLHMKERVRENSCARERVCVMSSMTLCSCACVCFCFRVYLYLFNACMWIMSIERACSVRPAEIHTHACTHATHPGRNVSIEFNSFSGRSQVQQSGKGHGHVLGLIGMKFVGPVVCLCVAVVCLKHTQARTHSTSNHTCQ
jgi:hypothetical protein